MSSRPLIRPWMSSRSSGVTNVDSRRWPMSWLISSPRCSVWRISAARDSGSSYVRSIASSWRAPARTFSASSTNRSKNRSSRGMRRRRTGSSGLGATVGSAGGRLGQRRACTGYRAHRACAMLANVDWVVIAFIGGQAILLAIAIGIILDRGRQLDAIREQTAAEATSDDLSVRVRRLQERLTASEFELDQQVRNASYLADL